MRKIKEKLFSLILIVKRYKDEIYRLSLDLKDDERGHFVKRFLC